MQQICTDLICENLFNLCYLCATLRTQRKISATSRVMDYNIRSPQIKTANNFY